MVISLSNYGANPEKITIYYRQGSRTDNAHHPHRARSLRPSMLECIQIEQDNAAWALTFLVNSLWRLGVKVTDFEVHFINSKRRLTSRLSTTTCVNLGSTRSTTFPPLSVINFDNWLKLKKSQNIIACASRLSWELTFVQSHFHVSTWQLYHVGLHSQENPNKSIYKTYQ